MTKFRYGVYLKTFKRIPLLERVITHILKNTSYLTGADKLTVVPDDAETVLWLRRHYEGNPRIRLLLSQVRRGSCGTYRESVEDSVRRGCDYTVVFEDDCFPYRDGWLPIVDQFFSLAGNRFRLLNFCVSKPFKGIYGRRKTAIVDGAAVRNQEEVGPFLVQDLTIDTFPFSVVKNAVFKHTHIVDPFFKIYGFWHSEMQLRLQRKGLIPWRTAHLKVLEEYIYAMDFLAEGVMQGLTLAEKRSFIHRNGEWSTKVRG